MIIEWLYGIGMSIGMLVLSWFPSDWEVPPFITDFGVMMSDLMAGLGGLAPWVDWVFVLACTAAVVAVWVVGLGIKVARAVAAHIPFFGGSG